MTNFFFVYECGVKNIIGHKKADTFVSFKEKEKKNNFTASFFNMEYLNLYEGFLLKNASQITSIETSLRTLTYILPGSICF